MLSYPITVLLPILVIVIAVVLIIWTASAVVQSWRERKRYARFKERMIAAFRVPRLFGYEEGQCLVCRGAVDRDQSQAQVAKVGRRSLRILSASDPSTAEIFLPSHSKTQIAHLACVSGHLTRRIDGAGRLFSNLHDEESTRYVAFHDFDTQQYYWGFFPRGWRPGDAYPNLPFSLRQPETLVEYLLARARKC